MVQYIVEADFQLFLRSGIIGEIKLGVTRDTIFKLLGDPTDWSAKDKIVGNAKVWRYEALELWFRGNELSYIGLHFDQPIPHNLRFENFPSTQVMAMSNFVEYLHKQQIVFLHDNQFPKDCGTRLVVEERTNVLFNEDDSIHSVYVYDN